MRMGLGEVAGEAENMADEVLHAGDFKHRGKAACEAIDSP